MLQITPVINIFIFVVPAESEFSWSQIDNVQLNYVTRYVLAFALFSIFLELLLTKYLFYSLFYTTNLIILTYV